MTGQVHRPWFRSAWFGAAAGAVAGFLLGWGIYALATPALEASDGLIRETQGLVWNLVPLLTVAGGVLGYLMTRPQA
jgi:cell division protein FtsX